jgi:hypothetical protein
MPEIFRAVLSAVLVTAAAIWLGGFVALAVVARVARRTVNPAQRVAFFRTLGRMYVWVGGPALLVGLASGAGLLYDRPWDSARTAAAATAASLLVVTVVGVVQARQMTRLRRHTLRHPDDTVLAGRVRRAARTAGVLRALIGLFSLALVILGVAIAN